ncbi:hypothetical protein GF377_00205 [candidate division GN15 bacterium]|nr:hypothetical protein [candidate division GN15 bacterium]
MYSDERWRQVWRHAAMIGMLAVLIALPAGSTVADDQFMKDFRDRYNEMGSELATKPPAEVAEISDFVYQKDVATLTLKQGTIYLLRKLDDRPTTAIFIGEGHLSVDVPSHVERQALSYAAKDTVVDETFESAFINFSDDLDLKLKEHTTFTDGNLPWRDFNKTQQGEFFFKPVVMHTYDHYFQLIRSHYERSPDGFFWCHVNRHVFSFDPNRPEEVVVGYEHEGGDQVPTQGVRMQRQETGVYDDFGMSNIAYPTTVVHRHGTIKLGGLDGETMDDASVTMDLQVNEDSLRFLSTFLHHNLKLDSIHFNGTPVDYWRRGSFAFIGVILPEYVYKGDTLSLKFFYHGRDFFPGLPFVENPAPSTHELTFGVRKGFDYIMPALEPAESQGNGYEWYQAVPPDPYRIYLWQPCPTGYDTIPMVSDIGLPVNILQSSSIDKTRERCFVPHEYYQTTNLAAFNYMAGRLGLPVGSFGVVVYPHAAVSLPGMMAVSQTDCYQEGTGGLPMASAMAAAQQWFGALTRPQSDREQWLQEGLSDYLSVMHVAEAVSPGVSFGELSRRRDLLYTIDENHNDWPLAAGDRVGAAQRQAKGSWVFHMLRFLMFDLDNLSDRTFYRFLNELKALTNGQLFTNYDLAQLAAKHYGQPLDWFFDYWLYSRGLPHFDVTYQIKDIGDGYVVSGDIQATEVSDSFRMPVVLHVLSGEGSTYQRVWVEGATASFELGPFASEPKELVFNEFFSVLSKDKVKRED